MATLPRWNLSDLFLGTDDPAIEQGFTTAAAETKSLINDYKGKVAQLSAERVRDLLERYERIAEILTKPIDFAFFASYNGWQRRES